MSYDSCLEVLLKLYPYLDGELPAEEAAAVRRHFEVCPPCAPALHYVRSFHTAIRRAAAVQESAPAELHERVNTLLRSETRTSMPS